MPSLLFRDFAVLPFRTGFPYTTRRPRVPESLKMDLNHPTTLWHQKMIKVGGAVNTYKCWSHTGQTVGCPCKKNILMKVMTLIFFSSLDDICVPFLSWTFEYETKVIDYFRKGRSINPLRVEEQSISLSVPIVELQYGH